MPDVCSPDLINLDLIDSFGGNDSSIFPRPRYKIELEESKKWKEFVRNFRKMIFDGIISRYLERRIIASFL